MLGGGAAQAGNAELQWSIVIGTPVYTPACPGGRAALAGLPAGCQGVGTAGGSLCATGGPASDALG